MSRAAIVDFPEPEGPTSAVVELGIREREKDDIVRFSGRVGYVNERRLNLIGKIVESRSVPLFSWEEDESRLANASICVAVTREELICGIMASIFVLLEIPNNRRLTVCSAVAILISLLVMRTVA